MSRRNPTKTLQIENRWKKEINRRWGLYGRRTLGRLRDFDAGVIVNAEDPFLMSPEQQRAYMAFVEAEIARLLLGNTPPQNWQNEYQLEAYQRGLAATRAQLIARGAEIVPTEAERLAAQGLAPFTATPALGATAVAGDAIHRDALEFLYRRSYSSLQNWTDRLGTETRQILFDGVAQGQGVDEITRKLRDRIGVSRSYARRIAQTETNQAYSRSSINEATRASEELQQDIRLRWLTVEDSKVRPHHQSLNNKVMTRQAAARVKMTDGVNCRCGLAPTLPRDYNRE